MKRTFAAVFAAFGLIVFANTGHAEFPSRDMTILVHASPGVFAGSMPSPGPWAVT